MSNSRGLSNFLRGRLIVGLQQILVQALLFLTTIWAIYEPNAIGQTDRVFVPVMEDYEVRYLVPGMVLSFVIYAVLVVPASLTIGYVEGKISTELANIEQVRWLAFTLLFGAMSVLFFVLLTMFLFFSWWSGDGCFPIYGGNDCPPKAVLPYLLFYAVSALALGGECVMSLVARTHTDVLSGS